MIVYELNDSVWAIPRAVTAADAGVLDDYFTARKTRQSIRRTIRHTERVFAVPAGNRDLHARIGLAAFSIESAETAVRRGAGLLAVVAGNAAVGINHEKIFSISDALSHHEIEYAARYSGCRFGDVLNLPLSRQLL